MIALLQRTRFDTLGNHPNLKLELLLRSHRLQDRVGGFREKVGLDPFRELAIDDTVLWIASTIPAIDIFTPPVGAGRIVVLRNARPAIFIFKNVGRFSKEELAHDAAVG